MADLQATAAANNLALNLAGKSAIDKFKVEFICIVDTLDKGMLVYRSESRRVVLPAMMPMHWAKSLFNKLYLLGGELRAEKSGQRVMSSGLSLICIWG